MAGPGLVRHTLNFLGVNDVWPGEVSQAKGKGDLIKRFNILIRTMARREDCEGIIVIVDSDNDCPVSLAKGLAERAQAASSVSVAIVCPVRMFENWFVCSAEEICPSEEVPPDCEHFRNPKRWLNNCLGGYQASVDQEDLVWNINFDKAMPRSPSLERLVNAISQLVGSIRNGSLVFTP